MIFSIRYSQDKKLEKIFLESMTALCKFYSFGWNEKIPKVFIVPDRKALDIITGGPTEKWLIACSDYSDNIYLLAPDRYKTETTHIFNEEEYHKLIPHELSHKFFQTVTNGQVPKWLDEGIAQYVADQIGTRNILSFSHFLENFDQFSESAYTESALAVELLIRKFGRRKLINLLESMSVQEVTNESFKESFEKIYGFKLIYTEFNSLRQ